jgi:pilus assembly protein Flp/PilA
VIAARRIEAWHIHCDFIGSSRDWPRNGVIAFRTIDKMRARDAHGRNEMSVINRLRAFGRNEEGQDLLEYALLISLIALVCVVAIGTAGTNVNTIFGNIASKLLPSS